MDDFGEVHGDVVTNGQLHALLEQCSWCTIADGNP